MSLESMKDSHGGSRMTAPTQRQIAVSFAYLAYCGEQITTPQPEATILDLIDAAMPQIPPLAAPNPTWKVVWGPSTYTIPGGLYQDNSAALGRMRVGIQASPNRSRQCKRRFLKAQPN